MKVSLKASDPLMMIEAYRMLAIRWTTRFTSESPGRDAGVGTIKSAVGLGALLSRGIGDDPRVASPIPPRKFASASTS
jgi:(E)-4-hydroxy-3-methylbut-2-enyl-diphosphate synthase